MTNLTITIEAPELAIAIKRLADAVATASSDKAEALYAKTFSTEGVKTKQGKTANDILQAALAKEWPEPKETPFQESPKTVESTPAITYTVEQVREELGKLSKAKGKAVARSILTEIGVKSVSDLQPEQFALAMQLIEQEAAQ